MNQFERIPAPMPEPVCDLSATLESHDLTAELDEQREIDDGLWVAFESTSYRFELCLTDEDVIEIRALKVFREGGGIGRQVVAALQTYAEETDRALVATAVEPAAEGFWSRLGFAPSASEAGVWYYAG